MAHGVKSKRKPIRQEQAKLARRLLKIGKDCAAHLKAPYRTVEHGDLLYNEMGLPFFLRDESSFLVAIHKTSFAQQGYH